MSHICLGTRDLPRILEFYRGVLGFSVAHEFRNEQGQLYGVFLNCGGRTFLEIFNDQETPANGGLFRHICFEVEAVETFAKILRSAGFRADVTRGRTDKILQVWAMDPDNNKVEFQEFDDHCVLSDFS